MKTVKFKKNAWGHKAGSTARLTSSMYKIAIENKFAVDYNPKDEKDFESLYCEEVKKNKALRKELKAAQEATENKAVTEVPKNKAGK